MQGMTIQFHSFRNIWRTASRRAVTRLTSRGGTKVLNFYFVFFLQFFQIIDEQDKMQRTPLYLAAKYNHLEVIKILIEE